jgi:hypothetical protein
MRLSIFDRVHPRSQSVTTVSQPEVIQHLATLDHQQCAIAGKLCFTHGLFIAELVSSRLLAPSTTEYFRGD